jgi:hypothetical protein
VSSTHTAPTAVTCGLPSSFTVANHVVRAFGASGAGADSAWSFSMTAAQSTGGNPSAAPRLMVSMRPPLIAQPMLDVGLSGVQTQRSPKVIGRGASSSDGCGIGRCSPARPRRHRFTRPGGSCDHAGTVANEGRVMSASDIASWVSALAAAGAFAAAAYQLASLRRDAVASRAAEIQAVAFETDVLVRPEGVDAREGRSRWVYDFSVVNPGRLPVTNV